MTIPTTADRLAEFTPESLIPKDAEGKPTGKRSPIVFMLRIPTWEERDEITLKMYRYGVRQVSTDAVRAVMISEWFNAKGDSAEEDALFLEGYWQQAMLHEQQVAEWRDRAIQQLADLDAGAPPLDEAEIEPEPPFPMGIRDRARAQRLTQEIIDSSSAVRARLADQHEYSRRFADLTARMTIAGWRGIDAPIAFDDNGVLERESVEALRSELFKIDAPRAWTELAVECQASYALPRAEEGNSDSPPENTSTGDGSPPASDGSASSDGPSTKPAGATKSSIEPTPGGGSPKSTARSSASTRGSGAEKKKRGRMAAPSSTSP